MIISLFIVFTLLFIIFLIIAMATSKTHASPKDFFLHLLAIVTLYISAFSFGSLVFQMINFNFPDELYYFHAESFLSSIRFSIAALIIALPAFMITSRFVMKDYQKDTSKKDLRIRLWLIYFTLFATAFTILISFMSIVYQFLGGELTVRFGLKVLTIFYIAGMIFGYYTYSLKAKKEEQRIIMTFVGVSVVMTILAIGLAFTYTGSPSTQRAREFDLQRINDLAMLSNEVNYYFDQKDMLPASLDVIEPLYASIPTDPQTKTPYEYRPLSETTYELCATFTRDRFEPKGLQRERSNYLGEEHFTAGRNCFVQKTPTLTKEPSPVMIR